MIEINIGETLRILWGKVIGLVRPMRLIDKSLEDRKRVALEYASHIIFSHFGRLDESKTAVCDRLSAGRKQSDETATGRLR